MYVGSKLLKVYGETTRRCVEHNNPINQGCLTVVLPTLPTYDRGNIFVVVKPFYSLDEDELFMFTVYTYDTGGGRTEAYRKGSGVKKQWRRVSFVTLLLKTCRTVTVRRTRHTESRVVVTISQIVVFGPPLPSVT